jgi:L-lactate dehydrogenase complex protein LldF
MGGLREAASQIKMHTLSKLDDYLLQFEAKAKRMEYMYTGPIRPKSITDCTRHPAKPRRKKCGEEQEYAHGGMRLNHYLQAEGLNVVDTDLGEYIVQLREETPSHIVLPAIHLKKEDVSNTFHQHIGTEKDNRDEVYLTRAARNVLRRKFIVADAAITGVNFAVAETGGIVICTNEGNADLGVMPTKCILPVWASKKSSPEPRILVCFCGLLARSATGQPITTYSSHFHRPQKGQEMHIVLVNNGRTTQLGREEFRSSLKCIRCAACFNTCPVYRRSGGHSYHNSVAGSYRFYPGAQFRYEKECRPAFCIYPLRFVQQCVPG